MPFRNKLAAAWRFLSGKKVWMGIGGFALEAAAYLVDKPELIAQLPSGSQGALNGILGTLVATGILHRAAKQEIKAEK